MVETVVDAVSSIYDDREQLGTAAPTPLPNCRPMRTKSAIAVATLRLRLEAAPINPGFRFGRWRRLSPGREEVTGVLWEMSKGPDVGKVVRLPLDAPVDRDRRLARGGTLREPVYPRKQAGIVGLAVGSDDAKIVAEPRSGPFTTRGPPQGRGEASRPGSSPLTG